MPSPFPGMDPYLEDPAYWSDFYASFPVYLSEFVNERLPDNYEARIFKEEDLIQTFRWIEILHRPERSLVSVVELLSPANKEEPGLHRYREKRAALLRQNVHLVELDLLLQGRRLTLRDPLPPGDYYALVSRGDRRPACEVYAWTLRQPLPEIPLPLKPPDPDLRVGLGEVFATAYAKGRYARSLRYAAPPAVRLPEEHREWVAQLPRTAS